MIFFFAGGQTSPPSTPPRCSTPPASPGPTPIPYYLPCFKLDHCYRPLGIKTTHPRDFGLTSLCSLLVHDTVSAFPTANGLARLDVIFGTTIFRTLLTYDSIRDIMLLTSTQVLHLLPRRR